MYSVLYVNIFNYSIAYSYSFSLFLCVSHAFDFYSKLTADILISVLKCSLIQFGFSLRICILIYLHVWIIFYLEFLMRAGGKKPYSYAKNDQYIVSDITFPVAFFFSFIYTRFILFFGFVFVLRWQSTKYMYFAVLRYKWTCTTELGVKQVHCPHRDLHLTFPLANLNDLHEINRIRLHLFEKWRIIFTTVFESPPKTSWYSHSGIDSNDLQKQFPSLALN